MLAHELSQASWRWMMTGMSSSEYCDWKKYFSKRGFRYEMENWRMGSIAASVWNVHVQDTNDLRTPESFYEFADLSVEKSDDELMELGANTTGGLRLG